MLQKIDYKIMLWVQLFNAEKGLIIQIERVSYWHRIFDCFSQLYTLIILKKVEL